MNGVKTITLSLVLLAGFELSGLGQSSTITTYAGLGRALPDNSASATAQAIGFPSSVITDTVGGDPESQEARFYFASSDRVYRVAVNGTLTVIAGTGIAGFSGDGGPATSAQLSDPRHLAVDRAGNLFIADQFNHRIRKVTPEGVISTVVGRGDPGFSGDGGPAAAARLGYPAAVAVDRTGNLFIADTGNHRIRVVTPEGVINTLAGTGDEGFGGDDGPAAAAQLGSPAGLAVDRAGNLLIADPYSSRIRKVNPDGMITTVAGNGTFGFSGDGGPATSAQLGGARGVAVDADGNLFIADFNNNRIRKVTAAGLITTVAGTGSAFPFSGGFSGDGGPAAAAQLNLPQGVAVDGGNLLIADSSNQRIRKINLARVITTVAGNGALTGFSGDFGLATAAELNGPWDVVADAEGDLFIADEFNHRIRKVTADGIITTVAGNGAFGFSGDGGLATAARLSSPRGLALDAKGSLFFADQGNGRIRKMNTEGVITTVAGTATAGFSGDGGPASAARLNIPNDVAVDGAGNLFIADSGNNTIRKVTPDGVITTVAGVAGPFTGNGFFEEGGFSGDDGPAISAHLYYPQGVAVDVEGNLFIADTVNNRIRKINPAGVITTVAGNGEFGFSGDGGLATAARLNHPSGVTLDGVGNLFIADNFNHRIRRVSPSGIISTVAGDGIRGFSGDGGPGTAAQLNFPLGVAVDVEGNLFIADSANQRIRKLTAALGDPGDPPLISAVYPSSGPTIGNTRIRVLGQNFQPGSVVHMGGVALPALTFKSSGELTALTPPLVAGIYSLEVLQPDGTTTVIPNAFTYVEVTKFVPRPPTASQSPIWRIPFVVDSPEFRTNLGINNVGGVLATVQISLVDDHGLLIAQASTTVPPFGMQQINHITRYLESASTVTGREGYLILESNQDIRAWASQIDNASADPSLQLARYDAAARVLLPSSVSNEQFSTRLTVINTSATDGQVNLHIRDSAGVLQASLLNQPIAGYGYLFFEDIHRTAGHTNFSGPIEIEGLNGIRVIATEQIVSAQHTGAYLEGVDTSTAGRSLVLYSLENADFRTNLGINNLGTTTANVTIGLVDKNGVQLGNLTTTVPAGGLTQLNRVNLAFGVASPGANLEGTLRIEADQDIVAWTSQIDNLTQDSSFVVGKNLQPVKLLIPSATRVGGFTSNLVVANLDASPATIELKFRDVEGNLKASSVEVIPGNGLLSPADILSKLGLTENYGPLEIVPVSGKPILALSRVYSLQGTAGTFEGVP